MTRSMLQDALDTPAHPSELILIRHAESARNRAKKGQTFFLDFARRSPVHGIPDHEIPLTDTGWEQARATGIEFRHAYGVPDALYHSGYRRTRETAEGILEAYTSAERARIRIDHDMRIRERDAGFAYDMTSDEAVAAFPWLDAYWNMQGGFMARPPGGQSMADLIPQLTGFLQTMARRHAGQRVVLVSHGGTIRVLRTILEHWDFTQAADAMRTRAPKNCSVTSYRFDPAAGRFHLQDDNRVFWNGVYAEP